MSPLVIQNMSTELLLCATGYSRLEVWEEDSTVILGKPLTFLGFSFFLHKMKWLFLSHRVLWELNQIIQNI